MKYVLAHLGLTTIATLCATGATWMVVTNTTEQVHYGVAMLALVVLGLVWIPVIISAMSLGEELSYQKWRKQVRRKMSRRHHPSKQVH